MNIQRVYNKVQTTGNSQEQESKIRHCQKTSKKPPIFWNQILWTDETNINLYQTDGKKKVWRKKGTTCCSIRHFLFVADACFEFELRQVISLSSILS